MAEKVDRPFYPGKSSTCECKCVWLFNKRYDRYLDPGVYSMCTYECLRTLIKAEYCMCECECVWMFKRCKVDRLTQIYAEWMWEFMKNQRANLTLVNVVCVSANVCIFQAR